MEQVKVNGADLHYEVSGSGDPVLLISTGPIADSFLPFVSDERLRGRYRLIRYRQRRVAAVARSPRPVGYAEHAADAVALLGHLGVRRAHVVGHSTGAIIALQLVVDCPEVVHSLALLEPTLMSVPSAGAFLEAAGPAWAAYGDGRREDGMAGFLSAVCSLDWDTCRAHVEQRVPGGVAQAIRDADDFFGSYLPALSAWHFGSVQAAAISQPVLSVLGSDSARLFAEGRDLLRSWFPRLEERTVEGVAHLLHLQRPEPVVGCVADFLARYPM